MSIRAGTPSDRSSAIAATAWFQRLSGLKRPILKVRHGVPAAARIARAAGTSTGASALSGMPLGMTTGLTPYGHIRCFMYLLTVVIEATKSSTGQSMASKPKRLLAFQSSTAFWRIPRACRRSLSALQNHAVCHSSQSTAVIRPASAAGRMMLSMIASGSVAVRSRILASSPS